MSILGLRANNGARTNSASEMPMIPILVTDTSTCQILAKKSVAVSGEITFEKPLVKKTMTSRSLLRKVNPLAKRKTIERRSEFMHYESIFSLQDMQSQELGMSEMAICCDESGERHMHPDDKLLQGLVS